MKKCIKPFWVLLSLQTLGFTEVVKPMLPNMSTDRGTRKT